jgi:hypothetical protein
MHAIYNPKWGMKNKWLLLIIIVYTATDSILIYAAINAIISKLQSSMHTIPVDGMPTLK